MVDFFATWFDLFYLIIFINKSFSFFRCGPCKTIAPHIEQLSTQYPNAVFLKADVEKCTVIIPLIFNQYYLFD
jgi:thiol-disulfide isomerase/thioredoxin